MLFLLAAPFLLLALVFLLRRKTNKGGDVSVQLDDAIDAWTKSEIAKLVADKLELEELDLAETLGSSPDPDIVTRLEKSVSGVEVVYERALDAKEHADLRVEVRLESGDLLRTIKRVPWAQLPVSVRDEFAKTGTAQIYRPWLFPWQR